MRRIHLFLLAGLCACSPATKDLKTAEGTLAEANRLLEEDFYEEARKQYMRIKTEFPESDKQVEADLKIAETYYEEESYKTAAQAFSEFLRTYPGRKEVPYVIYRLGLSYAKQMPSLASRDTRATHKAVDTFTRLLIDYPESEHAKEAQEWIDKAQQQLAEKVYRIADFYERQDQYDAAAKRFKEITINHADSKYAEESFARAIKNYKMAGKGDEAESLASQFKEQFPNSKFTLE